MPDATSLQLDIDLSQRRPLRDEAYVVIRRAIVNCDFKPGEHLNERTLAAQLGLSRSPVREALRRLEQEGLVAFSRQRLVVQELSLRGVEELYQIRQQLELLVVRLAARLAQPADLQRMQEALRQSESAVRQSDMEAASAAGVRFHEIMAETAGNQRLAGLLLNINAEIRRFRLMYAETSTRLEAVFVEHGEIFEAVTQHDEECAARLMDAHIERALQHIRALEQSGATPE